MGKLIDGVWVTDDVAAAGPDGQWRRAESVLRAWVTEDGPYRPEPGRYHLYAAWNCPWAHRALILRAVMGLEEAIGVSFARPRRTDQGWVFSPPGSGDGFEDALFGSAALHQVYTRAEPGYTGRVTVPVLFDEQTGRIVSNESSEIARMFGTVFRPLGTRDAEPVPDGRVAEIDAWNARIHRDLNNGVYRAGFASTQAAYDEAARDVIACLDALEEQLSRTRYLLGTDAPTEADWRTLPTLARFDVAYVGAFKCNWRRLIDHPSLWAYARDLYQHPGVAETVAFDIYKRGYFSPSETRNPHGIVPLGPAGLDWAAPHGRA